MAYIVDISYTGWLLKATLLGTEYLSKQVVLLAIKNYMKIITCNILYASTLFERIMSMSGTIFFLNEIISYKSHVRIDNGQICYKKI